MATFYVCRFAKTEINIPFSCDVTYFYGSNDKIYEAQGTLPKWFSLYTYTFCCCIASVKSFLVSPS